MMRFAVICLVLAIASSSEAATHKTTPHATAITPDVKALLHAGAGKLVDEIRNPDATRLRNIRISVQGADARVICGEINSQNGLGGMTGFKSFLIVPSGQVLMPGQDMGGVDQGFVIDKVCNGSTSYKFEPRDYTTEMKAEFDAAKGQ